MFLGVVHANARKILASYVPHLPGHVHVVCSGNFSIETTLRANGYTGTLTGCDVSLYTCSLGAYLAGGDIPLGLNLDEFPEFEPLVPFLEDQEGRAAAVAVVLDSLQFYPRRNQYQCRMFGAYEKRFAALCEQTRERLRKKRDEVRLDSFHAQDGWERVGEIPATDEHAVMTFPPTYEAGYEKLYESLHRAFIWQQPQYEILTSGEQFAERIVSRPGPWVIGAELPTPELEAIVGRPIAQSPRGSGVNVYLYSNIESIKPKLLRREINVQEPTWARLTDADEITPESKLTIHRITSPEANYIRQVYVSVGQASAQYSYAVAVDGKLVGMLLFQDFAKGSFTIEGQPRQFECMYMMADLAISSGRYSRLSKLVLLAATSAEMRQDLERRTIKEVLYNVTTAFSRKPSSMKYRGIFKPLSRKEEGGVYHINYYARMGDHTLQEAMESWCKKHLPAAASKPMPSAQTNA